MRQETSACDKCARRIQIIDVCYCKQCCDGGAWSRLVPAASVKKCGRSMQAAEDLQMASLTEIGYFDHHRLEYGKQ